MQTQTSNALRNAIMEAGGKDRPPMLASGNYVQWKSKIKRYIDTKPNHELIHYYLEHPPYKFKWAERKIPVVEGIDNDIYSTFDACPHSMEMWKAIERLKQGKAIINSPPPTYDQEPSMVAEDDEMSKKKEIDKLMALISLSFKKIYKPTNNNLKTLSNTSRANQDDSPRINRGTGYDNQRAVNVTGARETVEQVDWMDDTDDEPEDHELEAHYLYMAKIQEVTPDASNNFGPVFDPGPLQKVQYYKDSYNVFDNDRQHPEQLESVNDTYLGEQGDTNITTDSLDMSTNREEVDQDDDDDLARERDLLAPLIEKLKCEIDESKIYLKKFQAELDRYPDVNYASNVEIECCYNDNLALMLALESDETIRLAQESRSKLNINTIFNGVECCKEDMHKKTWHGYIDPVINSTIETNFDPSVHKLMTNTERFFLSLKAEMVVDLKYFNSLENEIKSLQSQLETQRTMFLNEIDRLSREYYYADHMNAILDVYTKLDEVTNLQKGIQRQQVLKHFSNMLLILNLLYSNVKNRFKMTKLGNKKNQLHFEN
ncbi:hypothetical protein Tco_1109076 [Tanacetum coccineum]